MKNPPKIAEATGKLGVLLVGMGAVSTTTIAGVLAIRRGLANPIGSLTQMGTVRLGKRTGEGGVFGRRSRDLCVPVRGGRLHHPGRRLATAVEQVLQDFQKR